MNAIIRVDVPDYQIGQEVSIYFKDTMMMKGIVQGPKTGHWISVSERLPEPDVEVLVTDDAGGLATISTDSIYESEVTSEKDWYTSQNVTAWMPLPKPYEPQESEEV